MSQEPLDWQVKAIFLAMACLFAFFFGALPVSCFAWYVDYPRIVLFLSPLALGFEVLLYLIIRLLLATIADCCVRCLNPWCNGCGAVA